jgi:putative salt-induced outer membrane protein YdiY
MRKVLFLFMTVMIAKPLVWAQAPAQPPKLYTGSFGGGFALTGGNTDTKNFNLTFDMVRDPKTNNVIKANASYLRGSQSDVLTLDRTLFNIRDEYSLTNRVFLFGQVDYLRDQFKQIIFIWSPAGGIGYKLINTDDTILSIDGGAGGFFEKNPGRDVSRSGSLNAGQRLRHKLSSNATFTQSLSNIWKTNDFEDYLTNFSVGLTSTIVRSLEVKLEFIDSYKRKPANLGVKRNDTAFVTAFVLKF